MRGAINARNNNFNENVATETQSPQRHQKNKKSQCLCASVAIFEEKHEEIRYHRHTHSDRYERHGR